jgi:hypothetical protein
MNGAREPPVQHSLTRLLLVIGKTLAFYSTFSSKKGRLNQLVNFHKDWFEICVTEEHSSTTLIFLTSVITVFGTCKLLK